MITLIVKMMNLILGYLNAVNAALDRLMQDVDTMPIIKSAGQSKKGILKGFDSVFLSSILFIGDLLYLVFVICIVILIMIWNILGVWR